MNRDGPSSHLAQHLEHTDPGLVALANRWIERRQDAQMQVGPRAFTLRWMPAGASPAKAAGGVGFELLCQQHRATLWLADVAAIDARLVGEPFAALPTPIKDLVAQRLLADFIAALPPSMAGVVQVQAVHWQAAPRAAPHAATHAVAFTLTRDSDGVATQGLLSCDTLADLQWLEEALPTGAAAPSPTPRDDLPLAALLHLGRVMAPARLLRALSHGDVLRMPRGGIARDGIAATLRVPQREAMQWPCRVRRSSVQIVAAADHAQAIGLSFAPHRDTPPQESPPMNAAAPSLDFEVPVDVELAQLSLTLAQIERLLPGQSIELPQEVSEAAVTLRVQGQAIAQGKLVVIGRALGVRVEKTFVAGDGAHAVLKASAAPAP